MFPHSSHASICPPKAEVLHFFKANRVLNGHALNPKSSSLSPNLFKTSATSYWGWDWGWVGCFFMVLKPLISSQILKKGYRAVKRVFVWKVVQFEDKSTSCQYFRDREDFWCLKYPSHLPEDASQNYAEAYEHSLLSIFLPFLRHLFESCSNQVRISFGKGTLFANKTRVWLPLDSTQTLFWLLFLSCHFMFSVLLWKIL